MKIRFAARIVCLCEVRVYRRADRANIMAIMQGRGFTGKASGGAGGGGGGGGGGGCGFGAAAAVGLCSQAQHYEVYINMVSHIANIPIVELATGHEDENEDQEDAADPVMFGNALHAHHAPTDSGTGVTNVLPEVPTRLYDKSASLAHTEDMVWHLLKKASQKTSPAAECSASDTFGLHLFATIPSNVTSLSQVLDMLCRADQDLFFHPIIYHIATIVAFQHYVRLVVLRTGHFSPQRTMNIQSSYQQTLLVGLFQTPLKSTQCKYMRDFDYMPHTLAVTIRA